MLLTISHSTQRALNPAQKSLNKSLCAFKVAGQMKMLVTKPHVLSLIPGPHGKTGAQTPDNCPLAMCMHGESCLPPRHTLNQYVFYTSPEFNSMKWVNRLEKKIATSSWGQVWWSGLWWFHSLATVFLFALFSKFLHSEQGREPGKSREGCGKMLEWGRSWDCWVNILLSVWRMFTAVTTLDEYALAAALQFARVRHAPLGDLARWVIISTLCALSLSLLN